MAYNLEVIFGNHPLAIGACNPSFDRRDSAGARTVGNEQLADVLPAGEKGDCERGEALLVSSLEICPPLD